MDRRVANDGHIRTWSIAGAAMLLIIAAEVWIYRDTWLSMYRTWVSIDTYNYGLIVPVISAYLLFRSRRTWLSETPSSSWWGVVATVGAALVWALGSLAGIQTLQHFSVLAMVPAAALAVLGRRVMLITAFPFAYLVLATPFGEFMVPALISWTADFSVWSLEVMGVPVFRDGPYIRIPAGDFHVVKACSGIRYLLTSVVLGVLFCYLGFRSWRRRAAFIAVCIVTPIIANWIRATCIILLGHISNMKIATGVDHFIYGWVFFGIVMFLIFLIGSRFSDGAPEEKRLPPKSDSAAPGKLRATSVVIGVAIAAAGGSLLVTAASAGASGSSGIVPATHLALPTAGNGWSSQERPVSDWRPVFVGARSVETAGYRRGDSGVSAIIAYYDSRSQGAEVVGAQNSLFDLLTWDLRFDRTHVVTGIIAAPGFKVREISVNNGQRNRLFWSWYAISGNVYANEVSAKLAAIHDAILGRPAHAYLVALAVDYGEEIEPARATLGEFLEAHADELVCAYGDACE